MLRITQCVSISRISHVPVGRCSGPGLPARQRASVSCNSSGPTGGPQVPDDDASSRSQNPESHLGLPRGSGPTFQDGVNWYCYAVIGLVFVTDFTPLGALIRLSTQGSGVGADIWLAGLQWVGFVGPTLWYSWRQGWGLAETFRLKPVTPAWLLGSTCFGSVLWVIIAAALAAKSGVSLLSPGEAAVDQSVLGTVVALPSDPAQWAQLLGTAAGSPALAEELLFRGFLLTAVLQRLGRVDAVCVVGALFAASHLDPQQFFGLAMLGFAAGGAALASGSLWPAVALHFGYNSAALAAGVLIMRNGAPL